MLALLADPSHARCATELGIVDAPARSARRHAVRAAAVDREPAHVPRVPGPGVGAGRARARRAARRRGARPQRRAVPRREAARAVLLREVFARAARATSRRRRRAVRRGDRRPRAARASFRSACSARPRARSICGCSRAGASELGPIAVGAATRIGFGRASSPGRARARARARARPRAARSDWSARPSSCCASLGRATSVIAMVGALEKRTSRTTCAARSITSCSPRPGIAPAGHEHVLLDRRRRRTASQSTRRGRRPTRARTSRARHRAARRRARLSVAIRRASCSALAGEPKPSRTRQIRASGLGYGPIDRSRRPRAPGRGARDRAAPARARSSSG